MNIIELFTKSLSYIILGLVFTIMLVGFIPYFAFCLVRDILSPYRFLNR